jgi:hypothetical protein
MAEMNAIEGTDRDGTATMLHSQTVSAADELHPRIAS